jgi:small conductance mechanosensitive channel
MVEVTIILILQVIAAFAGAFLIVEVLIRLTGRVLKRAGVSPLLGRSIRESLTIISIVVAVTAALTITGIASEFSIITVSGIVGLAVSLALQNTLSNVISGMLLLSDGVLRLNDSITYSGVKGVVVKIGLRSTWLKTETGEIAVMNNSNLASGPFVNYTAAKRLERKLRA